MIKVGQIIKAILLAAFVLNPLAAAAKSDDARRVECIFSFGFAKESCKRGFDGSTLGEVTDEIANKDIDGIFKSFKSKDVQNLVLEVATPDSLWFSFDFSGNGFQVIYKTHDKIERVIEKVKDGSFDAKTDVFKELVPDELRITVGINLALVLTVRADTTLVYKTMDNINKILKVLNEQ